LHPGGFSAVPAGLVVFGISSQDYVLGYSQPSLRDSNLMRSVLVQTPETERPDLHSFPSRSPWCCSGNTFALDLLLLFSYIDPYAHSPFPQVLRRLLQEVRPRRVKRNGRLPCQLHLRGVLDVRRETPVSALRSNPWQAAFGRPAKTRSGCRPPRSSPR
jgi:hypothetical protein